MSAQIRKGKRPLVSVQVQKRRRPVLILAMIRILTIIVLHVTCVTLRYIM